MRVLSRFSHVPLFETPWIVARQAPRSKEFSTQEYWSVLPYPSPGDIPNSGIEPTSLVSLALAGGFLTTSAAWEALRSVCVRRSVMSSPLRPHGLPYTALAGQFFICSVTWDAPEVSVSPFKFGNLPALPLPHRWVIPKALMADFHCALSIHQGLCTHVSPDSRAKTRRA